MTEATVKLAARLYDARDTAKRLLGDKYRERVAEFQEVIRDFSERSGMELIACVMDLVDGLQKRGGDTAMSQMMIFAAYVETLEPTP